MQGKSSIVISSASFVIRAVGPVLLPYPYSRRRRHYFSNRYHYR